MSGSLISAALLPRTSSSSKSALGFLYALPLGHNIAEYLVHQCYTRWVTHQQSPSWTTGTTANQPTNLNKIFLPNKLPPPSALTLFNSSLSFSTSDWATIRSFWTKLDGKVHYWIAIFMSTLVLCCSASKFAKFDRKLFTSCSSWSLDELQ